MLKNGFYASFIREQKSITPIPFLLDMKGIRGEAIFRNIILVYIISIQL